MKMVVLAIAGCTTSNAILLELALLGQQVVPSKPMKHHINGKIKIPLEKKNEKTI